MNSERYRLTNEEKWVVKPKLYENSGGHCQFPDCDFSDYWRLTIHHVLPIHIAIEMGLSREVVNCIDNLMLACRQHHNLLDQQDIDPDSFGGQYNGTGTKL